MNYSKYRFNLDMQTHISQVSLPVRQHDTGISLYIGLTDGGNPYTINDGCLAAFYARKADGEAIHNFCVIENNTLIKYELTPQTTSCSGVVDCEIRLFGKDGNIITTPRFIMVVDERVVHDSDFPLSESETTILDNIIVSETARVEAERRREETYEQMLESVATATEAVESAERAVGTANEVVETHKQNLANGAYNGLTPYIKDGTWWIGEEDTGISADAVNHSHTLDNIFESINEASEKKFHYVVPATSNDGGATFTATIPGLTSLYNGLEITIIPNTPPKSGSATLDVNGLGAKDFRMQKGTNAGNVWGAINKNFLSTKRPCNLIYDGSTTGFWRLPATMADATDFQGTLAIAKGGTGATTAEAAIQNLGGARTVKGSYTGTGSGTVTLDFDFVPRLLIVSASKHTTAYNKDALGIFVPELKDGKWFHKGGGSLVMNTLSVGTSVGISVENNSVTITDTEAVRTFDYPTVLYHYTAIG